jgi:hypothetical protein
VLFLSGDRRASFGGNRMLHSSKQPMEFPHRQGAAMLALLETKPTKVAKWRMLTAAVKLWNW